MKKWIVDQGILSLLSIGYHMHPGPLEAFEIQMLVQATSSMARKWEDRLKEQQLQTD